MEMFEKLFLLVKNNAGTAVISNPAVPEKYHEAVINDASSSIIEVLKGQMENGKLKDLVNYFQFSGVFSNPLISSAVKKFANKLNNFYNIDPTEALKIANELIPPVMQEMIRESKGESKDFSLGALLAKLSGNLIDDMTVLLNQLAVA
jgi:hypothetical protein